jgi:signal transduction histidine kinase
MFAILNYFSLSLLLGGFVALLSGSAVFFSSHRGEERISWMLLNLSTAVWSFGYFGMITLNSKGEAILSNLILHYGAILIPLFYLYFVLHLTKTFKKYKKILLLFSLPAIFFLLINKSTVFVLDVIPKGPFSFAPDAGPLYIYFTIYFFATVIVALTILYRQIKYTEKLESKRLTYVFLSSLAGFSGGGSVFFLTFNIQIPPYLISLFAFYPILITYAISKHKLFDMKVVSTEILTGIVWIILLFRTVLSNNIEEQILNGVIFALIVLAGIFLVRSVRKEVEAREKLEILTKQLESANDKLTELDRLKTEFLSLASHQFRSPLTAMKGYASLILEGSYGSVNPSVKDAVNKIFISANNLAQVVQDFLDVSRIEQGKMKYEMERVDLKDLINEVIDSLRPNIEEAGLEISLDAPLNDYFVNVDKGKFNQVFINTIDNAQKYTKKGSITIFLSKDDGNILAEVRDTGLGIVKEEIPKLFDKFVRSKGADEVNVKGTGLGLYIVKKIIEAHEGKIWVESEGVGKGSSFFVELDEA